MKLSVIIVTYNGVPWLKKCLDSCKDYHVVVVDNASTDATVSTIQNDFPEVTLLQMTKNLGFGRANNIGISHALKLGAAHVFLLNQDAYLVDDVLEQLIELQELHPNYGVLSPIHITGDKTRLDKNFFKYMLRAENDLLISDLMFGNAIKDVYEVPFVNAAAWLISKPCLMVVGGFDPLFFHYGEDANFCQRLLYHGFKTGVVPHTYVIHDRTYGNQSKPKPYTAAYYAKFERHSKLLFANINDDCIIEKMASRFNMLRGQFTKGFLTLSSKAVSASAKKRRILKRIIPEILESRRLNAKEQPNYLDLD